MRDYSLSIALDGPAKTDVSIVVPCYNQSQFLREAIDSVLAQTYPHWECIIVNDGSTDDTLQAAAAIIAEHPLRRFCLINQRNQGLSSARNSGIRASQGRYILPLDCDDKIDPRMIESQIRILEADPAISIVHTDVRFFGHTEEVHQTGPFQLELLKTGNRICYCSMHRREVWEESGGYNPNMTIGYEDWDYWVGAAQRGRRAQRIPEPLLIYRTKAESMYTTAFKYDIFLRARIVANHQQVYDPDLVNTALKIIELHSLMLARSVEQAGLLAKEIARTFEGKPFPEALGSLDRFVALLEAHQEKWTKEEAANPAA